MAPAWLTAKASGAAPAPCRLTNNPSGKRILARQNSACVAAQAVAWATRATQSRSATGRFALSPKGMPCLIVGLACRDRLERVAGAAFIDAAATTSATSWSP